jgi:hypothetical protein
MADTLNTEVAKLAEALGITVASNDTAEGQLQKVVVAITKKAKAQTLSLAAAEIFKGSLEQYNGPAAALVEDVIIQEFEKIEGNIQHLQKLASVHYTVFDSLNYFASAYFDGDDAITTKEFQELIANLEKLLERANEAALEVKSSADTKGDGDEDPMIGKIKSLPQFVRRVARLDKKQQQRMRELLKKLDALNSNLAGGAMRGQGNDTTVWFELTDWFGGLSQDDVELLSCGIGDIESLGNMVFDGFIVQAGTGLCNDELKKRLGAVVKAYHGAL